MRPGAIPFHAKRRKISIHAPHSRCDLGIHATLVMQAQFQSTHLIRGATDLRMRPCMAPAQVFQSTHLIRGATPGCADGFDQLLISIHAPHSRCDRYCHRRSPPAPNFNPRTSFEVRRCDWLNANGRSEQFQSTHLIRGATPDVNDLPSPYPYFNPRTSFEVRPCYLYRLIPSNYFNPRTSFEVRR